ncbi:hypothetical protein [Bacillus horti]|uniref:Major virion structural protein n=1 Tax=Caldalkalibacillus horti TaxID=77523 RepID=A0ABT9W193_9BACI|nr:hypothetical protein [Bacillus horti]MDQ0166620.1 hypothetical protein [Bacillus horti]
MINQDGFFDETLSVQLMPQELEELFNEAGWKTTAKYRVFHPLQGDSYRKKFGEVRLFSSTGSDEKKRNFGFISGYGGKVTPVGEEPIISKNSFLGELEEIEGSNGLKFKFKVFPVLNHSVLIYDEQDALLDEASYTVDGENGEVTFTSAPDKKLVATFALTDNAPEMTKRLWFFTFEDFRPERSIFNSEGLEISRLQDPINGQYHFPLKSGESLKHDTVVLYSGRIGAGGSGQVIPTESYTIDYAQGSVSFESTYTVPPVIYADYTTFMSADDDDFGDLLVPDFKSHDPEELAGAAYSGLRLIFPSIPTAVSFIPDDEYGLGWGRSSQIYVWGNASVDRIISYFRVDPAPDPEKTYFAPLYIGRLSTIGKEPRLNNALIGGSRGKDQIEYVSGLKLGRNVVDYGPNTSNGNTSVMLQQSVGGAMYQKYYLSFITHDAEADRTNESRFNPSVYSGKYHISPMYIVHPSDGYVGRLDEVYAIHPKNISQLDELEVTEKAKDEHLGNGDGTNKVFHLFHKPVLDEEFRIQLVSDDGCSYLDADSGGFTIHAEDGTKLIELESAPERDVEVYVTYNYNQVYRFTLADTPTTPFRLANMTPYNPIGLGFLKENIN